PFAQAAVAYESLTAPAQENPSSSEQPAESETAADKKHRRRGRRGGRNRRKTSPGETTRTSTRAPALARIVEPSPEPPAEILPPRTVDSRAIPRIPVEQVPDSGTPAVKGRFGNLGLVSRLSLLEMQLPRLLTCPTTNLDEYVLALLDPCFFFLTHD